jgi:hypothetical protein
MTTPATRTITRTTKTEVSFSNDEVKALLLKAAGVPDNATDAELRDEYGDNIYLSFAIVWTTQEIVQVTE